MEIDIIEVLKATLVLATVTAIIIGVNYLLIILADWLSYNYSGNLDDTLKDKLRNLPARMAICTIIAVFFLEICFAITFAATVIRTAIGGLL